MHSWLIAQYPGKMAHNIESNKIIKRDNESCTINEYGISSKG